MDRLPQKNLINPAINLKNSNYVLGISASSYFHNSSLTFNDLLEKRTINGVTEIYWDFEMIDKKLRNVNFINLGASITPVFFGFEIKNDWHINFSTSLKNRSYLQFPGSISKLRLGNANIETNTPRNIDLNDYSLNQISYAEFCFGASKKLGSKLTIGLHIKTLAGLSAIQTNKFNASIETTDDFSKSILKTDIEMDVSGTLFESDKITNVFRPRIGFGDFVRGKGAISFKNFGSAFDIGFSYQFNKKWLLYASLIDIGSVQWKLEPQKLISKGEYTFDGLQFSPYVLSDENFDFKDYLKQYADTVSATIIPESKNIEFKSILSQKSYFGISYQYSEKIRFNGLLHTEKNLDVVLTSVTIGTNWTLNKKFSLTGSLSYSNFWLYNIGLGIIFNTKQMEFFIVTDNLNSIDSRNSRAVNLAFGTNFFL